MNWDVFARDLKDKWGTLDPPARARSVLRWKNESKRSARELARILGKSESALRALLSGVEKKNEQHRAPEVAKGSRPPAVVSQPGAATNLATRPNVVVPASIAPATQRMVAPPAKPAAVSTVVGQIIAWMDRQPILEIERPQVAGDIKVQLDRNRTLLERDVRKLGPATLEVRPPDLCPNHMEGLSIWGIWAARFLWLYPRRDEVVKELCELYKYPFLAR